MDVRNLKAVLTEEEETLRREDSLEAMRRLLRADPERFRLRAAPAAFPDRKKSDHRKRAPEAMKNAPRSGPFPSRLPWELLPASRPERVRTRIVYRTLPAGELADRVRAYMKENRITMEKLASYLHIAPGTFRKWLQNPENMTIRDYGALVAWVNRQPGKAGEGRLPG